MCLVRQPTVGLAWPAGRGVPCPGGLQQACGGLFLREPPALPPFRAPPWVLWPSHGCQLLSVLQEPNKGVNPDEAVAYGAAVQVGLCLLGG